MQTKRVAIVGGVRTAFVKSFGLYHDASAKELMTHTLQALVDKFDLKGQRLGEVALGAVIKHSKDWNLARESVLGTNLDPHTPAFDLQRACGTSLEATLQIANKIALGQIECGIAGGVDTNSDAPIAIGDKLRKRLLATRMAKNWRERLSAYAGFTPFELGLSVPTADEPRTGLRMGDHCELMAKEWQIAREEQDELAYASHQNAAQAYDDGFYDELLSPFRNVKKDGFVRPDTSLEKLSKLKPAFDKENGTLTAGNSTPLTDGSAAVFLASEELAKKKNWPILAYFRDGQSAAVDFVGGEGLLMAPTYAVAQMLKRNDLKLQDFNIYEIHEAFAAQVLCTLKAWESAEYCKNKLGLEAPLGRLDRAKMNLKGGSVALGHPFAATGARNVMTLAKLLSTEAPNGGRGLISVCTAGGMGVAAILER